MTDCSKCKHFIYCDWGKILFSKVKDCKEFEERKNNNDSRTEDSQGSEAAGVV